MYIEGVYTATPTSEKLLDKLALSGTGNFVIDVVDGPPESFKIQNAHRDDNYPIIAGDTEEGARLVILLGPAEGRAQHHPTVILAKKGA